MAFRNTAQNRLENLLIDIENESDKKIDPKNYYVVTITLERSVERVAFEKHIKAILKNRVKHRPLTVYISWIDGSKSEAKFLYSCVDEDDTHYADGKYHIIISEFVSLFHESFGASVCKITELSSRLEVLAYIQKYISDHMINYMMSISKGAITQQNVKTLTLVELVRLLKLDNIIWKNLPSEDKFGILWKYNSSGAYEKLSGVIDAQQQQFENFIF